jgi:hypothetical protein
MHIRIYYYSPTEPAGFSQPFSGVAATIWSAMQEAYANQPSDFLVDFGWREWIPGFEEIDTTGVKNGGVVMYDWDRQAALVLIEPGNVTKSNIKSKLEMLYSVHYEDGSGYVNADGSEWGFGDGQGNGECVFKNLPILGNMLEFLCGIEKILWAGLAVFAGLKTLESPTKEGKYGWGALAAFSGYKTAVSFKLLQA